MIYVYVIVALFALATSVACLIVTIRCERRARAAAAEAATHADAAEGRADRAAQIARQRIRLRPGPVASVQTWEPAPDGQAPDAPPVDLTDCIRSIEPHDPTTD